MNIPSNLFFIILNDIHQFVVIKVRPEFLNCLTGQFKKQIRLFVIIYFRVIHEFINNDIFWTVMYTSALPAYNINTVFLFTKLFYQNFFRYRLVIQIFSVKVKILKARPYIIALLNSDSWNLYNILHKIKYHRFIGIINFFYHFSGK